LSSQETDTQPVHHPMDLTPVGVASVAQGPTGLPDVP
jgi:hypothetical protein